MSLLTGLDVFFAYHRRFGELDAGSRPDRLDGVRLRGQHGASPGRGRPCRPRLTCCKKSSAAPSAFHAFRGPIEPLDAPRDAKNIERLAWDVRRGMSSILNHPWIPTAGPDAVALRGFIYDVDTGKLEEVTYPGPMGSIG